MNLLIVISVAVGVLLGLVLMLMPVVSTWILLLMSMFAAGTVQYFFPALGRIYWGVGLISLILLVRCLVAWFQQGEERRADLPPFFTVILLLLCSVLVTTVLNRHFVETLVSSKNFFQFLSVPLVFYLLVRKDSTADGMMKALLAIAVLQLPLAVLQRLYSPGFDTITGSFGGSWSRPGPNSALAIFLTVQTGVVLALALNKALSWRAALFLSAWFAVPVYLTNARAIVAFYFVMLLLLFGRYALRRPLAGALAGTVVLVMLGSTLYLHYAIGWENSPWHEARDFRTYVQQSVTRQLGPRQERMNRTKAVVLWWEENRGQYGTLKIAFGHGLGASRAAGIRLGHLAERSEYRDRDIGKTALARLLWDIGLIGAFAYIMVFVSAFFTARRLAAHPGLSPARRAYMTGAQIACAFIVMSIPYKESLIHTPALSAFIMFVLGHIAFWHRRLSSSWNEAVQQSGEGTSARRDLRPAHVLPGRTEV